MIELGHGICYLRRVGIATWELKDGRGRVLYRGSRRGCWAAVSLMQQDALGKRMIRPVQEIREARR